MVVRWGTCTLCEAMCGIEITIEGDADHRPNLSVRGDRDDPLSRGHICPKALALIDVHQDADRLRHPVRRVGDRWEEIGWDEAFDLVADGLSRAQRRHGRDAVGVYWGNPMAHSLGALTHGVGALVPALETANVFSATSLDSLPHFVVHRLLYGHRLLAPVPDIDRTDHLLVLGANPSVSNGSMMSAPDIGNRLRALRARGGRLVVVDPRRTETARVADEHVPITPGTDAFLLLAMIRTVLGDGAATAPSYVDGVAAVAELVDRFTPEAVADRTGIAPNVIRRLARDLAAAPRAVVHGRMGVSTQRYGTVCQWALNVLNIVTGNLDVEGGVLFTDPVVNLIDTDVISRGEFGTAADGLPTFAGERSAASLASAMAEPEPDRIRSLLVLAGNPVLSAPGGRRLDSALDGLDFMAAVDFYVNETTRHAHVILPPTSHLQREHYDLFHHHFAVRNTAKFSPAPLPRSADERHDWEIYRGIARAYLRRRGSLASYLIRSVSPAGLSLHARLAASPTRILAVLLRLSRRRSRPPVTVETLRRDPHGIDFGPLAPSLPGRLLTADHRIDLLPTALATAVRTLGLDDGPSAPTLLLIGRRHLRSNNSWLRNSARMSKGPDRTVLLMHPDDVATNGVTDGARVRVTSASGSVEACVRADGAMTTGVVSLPHGFEPGRVGVRMSVATTRPGPSANDLTDPSVTDSVSGAAVFNGVPVTVSPLGG